MGAQSVNYQQAGMGLGASGDLPDSLQCATNFFQQLAFFAMRGGAPLLLSRRGAHILWTDDRCVTSLKKAVCLPQVYGFPSPARGRGEERMTLFNTLLSIMS